MNYEWSLDRIYTSFDCEDFLADWNKIDTVCDELSEFVAKAKLGLSIESAAAILRKYEEIYTLIDKTMLYISLRFEADSNSEENMKMFSLLVAKDSKLSPVLTIAMKLLSEGNFYEEAEKTEKLFADYKFMLKTNCESAKHYLSDDSEEMYSLMNMTGGSAWGTMHSALTSSLAVDYDGKTVTLSEIRNLAYSADADVRKKAYEAELAAYKKIEQPIAFALNNIKLQSTNIALKRGYASPLDATLKAQNMSRETLDTMLGEIKKYLPVFHRYLRAKAKLLGYENGLPWYDMFAPIGESEKTYTPEEAGEFLVSVFSDFSKDMAGMIEAAFRDGWIDFYPREGKSGGAFCAEAGCLEESRILTNFDGTFSAVDTLAHELGHAFHNFVLKKHRILNRAGLPMPLAETASTFNETFLMNYVIANADPDEKLALIDSFLIETTQIMCDIYSRYLFESKVFEKCVEGFISAERLCEFMLEAQKEAYGDGLDNSVLHPYMWVCKGHYYSESLAFYNFPYAFGGLLATGLYAKYEKEPSGFDEKYQAFLYETTVNTIEDAAMKAGIDVTSPEFWDLGLEKYKSFVEEFCALIE
jgi:pepF/M3 family oligoendopeptidase